MTLLLILLFLKRICLYLNNIVFRCYNSFLINPNGTTIKNSNHHHHNTSNIKNNTNQCRNYRSILSTNNISHVGSRYCTNDREGGISKIVRPRKLRKLRGELERDNYIR